MTNLGVQLAMVRLAESIRRLPEGPVEQQVRASFLNAVERLQVEGHLLSRDWHVWASRRETFLWAVTQDDHTIAAVLRHIQSHGFEVRILVNGEASEVRLFPGKDGSTAARTFAIAKRDELSPGPFPAEGPRAGFEAALR